MAKTDLEIGDKVKLNKYSDLVLEVYDIRTVHYLRKVEVEFEFQLIHHNNLTNWFKREDIIYPIPSGGEVNAT